MKKDKEWLKKEVEEYLAIEGCYDARTALKASLEYIDQLDEPEKVVVSKMEKVVIPQFVADWIEESKGVDDDFWEAATEMIRDSITSLTKKGRKVHDWLFGNSVIVTVMLERQKLITRAWLDGYEVEKEKLYKVTFLENRHVLTRRAAKKPLPYNFTVLWEYSDEINRLRAENPDVDKFTEQEIKAIDERYWAFAEEVME